MANIVRFYLSGKVSKTVAISQMRSWAELLKEKGVSTYFIILAPRNKMGLSETIEVIRPYKIIYHPDYPILREVVITLKLFSILLKFPKDIKIIFQTRMPSFGSQLLFLKIFFNVKIISDFRGIGEEDYNKTSKKNIFNSLNTMLNNRLLGKFSDARFFVSNALKEEYSRRFNVSSKNNYIIPGAADKTIFFNDLDLRLTARKKMGLEENNVVFLYSGMINKPWQIPEKIFKFFSDILRKNTFDLNPKLFIITPNIQIAEKLREVYDIPENDCLIQEAKTHELNTLYNIADYGMLFRQIHIVNQTASPTKFTEYLLSGLPVLITPEIGDYSKLIVDNQNFGQVIEWENESLCVSKEIVNKLLTCYNFDRPVISEYAQNMFSKQSFIRVLENIYKNI